MCRRSITDRVYSPQQPRVDDDEDSTSLDEVHLALIKGISGPVPHEVCGPVHLKAESAAVAGTLFSGASMGRLQPSEEQGRWVHLCNDAL